MHKTIYTKAYSRLISRLKKARAQAGLRQKDAARRLKTTQSYISKMESGQTRIDIIQLKEIARIYKKNLEFFTE